MMHLAFAATDDVVVDRVTVQSPADSPNTDGIDPAGRRYLIEDCEISTGDDNIAVKAGGVACSDIQVRGCRFGTGHGLSIGGQTACGVDGMLVTDCAFLGTTNGLRIKADATQGGLVKNVSYRRISMSGVAFPIAFYSYYNRVGAPGAPGASGIGHDRVQAWNASPPDPLAAKTLPAWENVTIDGLVATKATGYSVIWGLPTDAGLGKNVELRHVRIEGGLGLKLYDASDISLEGRSELGPVEVCNALALVEEPKDALVARGRNLVVEARAIGAAGTAGGSLRYSWFKDGLPLVDGPRADGSIVFGAASGRLSIMGVGADEAGTYRVAASLALDLFDAESGALRPSSFEARLESSGAKVSLADSLVDASYEGPAGLVVDGTPRYARIGDALAAAPSGKTSWRIAVAPGGYREKLIVDKPKLELIGSGAAETTVVWGDWAGEKGRDGRVLGDRGSATVAVLAPGVKLEGFNIMRIARSRVMLTMSSARAERGSRSASW